MAKLSTQTYDCPTFRKSARLLVAAFMCLLATHKSLAECKYYFSPIDKQFDQIAIEINRADYDNERQGINPSWLDKLDSIAKKSNNRQLKARAIYWRVRSTQMDAQPSLCLPMLKEADRGSPLESGQVRTGIPGRGRACRGMLSFLRGKISVQRGRIEGIAGNALNAEEYGKSRALLRASR